MTETSSLEEGVKNAAKAKKQSSNLAEYHFSLAQAYVAEGNPDRAIEEYKLTLMFDPNSSLVYARLATEYIKKGMMSAAMEACKEALQRDPNFTDARLILAGLYSTSRDTPAAVAEYDRILAKDPKNEEATIYKSQVLMEDSRPSEAVELLTKYTKRNPESALGFYYLGRAEQARNRFKESVVAFRKALNIRPAFSQAAFALGYLYEEKGMNAQAIEIYQELFDDTQDLGAANRLATIYLKQEKYQKAVPYLEAVEAADPEDLNVRVKLGLIYMEVKQYDKAVALFNNVLAKSPDSDRVRFYLGSLYEETKQFDKAIDELKRISASSKMYPDAVLHVAYLMKQQSRMDESKSYIREMISKTPDIASFHIFHASLEEETKDLKAAVKILEKALTRFAEDEKVRYYLGSLYDRLGEIDKGLDQMEAILKINPKNVDALNYIGYTWTQKGIRLDDAEKLLRKALELKPNNAYIQDSWGWHLFVRGRTEQAVVELEKAIKLKSDEATILEHLADAYLKANLREKALARYRDAVRYAENDETRQKIEGKLNNLRRELAQQEGGVTADRSPAEKH